MFSIQITRRIDGISQLWWRLTDFHSGLLTKFVQTQLTYVCQRDYMCSQSLEHLSKIYDIWSCQFVAQYFKMLYCVGADIGNVSNSLCAKMQLNDTFVFVDTLCRF